MIITEGCTKEVFEENINKLKKASEDPENASFAAGGYYAESGSEIHDALRIADENMYTDKERYYAEHPERKYR